MNLPIDSFYLVQFLKSVLKSGIDPRHQPIMELTPNDLSNILLIRGLRTFPSDNIKPPKVLDAKEDRQLYEKARRQRNCLAHGEVTVNNALLCMENIKKILKLERRHSHDQCASPERQETVELCFSLLSKLSSRKQTTWSKLSIAVSQSSCQLKGALRLAHSSLKEADFFGREDILRRILSKLLQNKHHSENTEQNQKKNFGARVLIHGPPGVGKTAIVRRVATLTRETIPQQYTFQATTEGTLAMDITSFLRHSDANDENVQGQMLYSAFKQALDGSNNSLLLIFEDVIDPSMVASFLPRDKHYALFTSLDDTSWRESESVLGDITKIPVNPLMEDECFKLLENILASNEHQHTYDRICKTPYDKYRLSRAMTEDMLGLPLAIRLFAFQLCDSGGDYWEFLAHVHEQPSFSRSKVDEKSAGLLHVRGFHNLVRYALKSLKCTGRLHLAVCFLLSVLPGGKINILFLEATCKLIGISSNDMHNSLCKLSQVGLVSKQNDDWTMNQVVKRLLSRNLADQKDFPQQAVLKAVLQGIRNETIGTLDEPISDIKEDWSSVFDTPYTNTVRWDIVKTFRKQELYMELNEIIDNVPDDTFPLQLSWEQRDMCVRCMLWFQQRNTYFQNSRHVHRKIVDAYVVSGLISKEAFDYPNFETKESFLRFLSIRWGCLDVSMAGTFERILFDLETHLSIEFPIDLMELLGCLGEALLSTGLRMFNEKQSGLIVVRIFDLYGISKTLTKDLFRSGICDKILKCVLLYCRALAETGQLDEAETLLTDVVKVWKAQWKMFTVGCCERLVHLILSFAISFESCRRYSRCLFWSDLAFHLANSSTASSDMPCLSLQACSCACKCILGLAPRKVTSALKFSTTCEFWMERLSVFTSAPFSSPVYTQYLCHNVARVFFSLVFSYGFTSPLTLGAWQLFKRSFCNYQVARRFDISTGIAVPFFLVLIVASGVRRKKDLNVDLLKQWGKLIAQNCKNGLGLYDLLLEFMSTFCELSVEQKCSVFGFAVAITSRVGGFQGGSEDNPLVVSTAMQNSCETLDPVPDPEIFREVISVLLSEAAFYRRDLLAEQFEDLLKMWFH